MLVLDGRVGETFYIGDNIEVTLLRDLGRKKMKLGFTAPKDVVILREKVKKRAEKEEKDD